MSVSVTTDVHCDRCSQWQHFICSDRSTVVQAKLAARAAGWTAHPGQAHTICPACNGTAQAYWDNYLPDGNACGSVLQPRAKATRHDR